MFKPMLSATYEDRFKPKYPVLASPKLDGIRLIMVDGKPMTRSLKKPLPNLAIRAVLEGLPWFDGEILVGNPSDPCVCARTQSVVTSRVCEDEALFNEWRYYIFDFVADLPFLGRYNGLKRIIDANVKLRPELEGKLVLVEHKTIRNENELYTYEDECVSQGYEGIMVRDPNGPYKFGRSTAKERYLTKFKRWEDTEGIVLEVYEELHNGNEAFINALGKTERSSHKENKTGTEYSAATTVTSSIHA